MGRGKKCILALGAALTAVGLLCAGSALLRGGSGAEDLPLGQALSGDYGWDGWDGTVLFLGDSITDFCDLSHYYPGLNAVNQGVSGETTADILARMDRSVYAYDPDILVLLAGVNDVLTGYDDDTVVEDLRSILDGVRRRLPETEIILQSIYPVAEGEDLYYTGHIRSINGQLEQLAREYGSRYVDVYSALCAADGRLDGRYSDDGLHPNDAGYRAACPLVAAAIGEIAGGKPLPR